MLIIVSTQRCSMITSHLELFTFSIVSVDQAIGKLDSARYCFTRELVIERLTSVIICKGSACLSSPCR